MTLEATAALKPVPTASHTWRIETNGILLVHNEKGDLVHRVQLIRDVRPTADGNRPPRPGVMMAIIERTVYVPLGNRIYHWSAGNLAGDAQPVGDDKEESEFYVVPEQSAFFVKAGKTVLNHKTEGGTGPLKFVLQSKRTGVSINPATGTITIDSRELASHTVPLIKSTVRRFTTEKQIIDRFQEIVKDRSEWLKSRVGRSIQGVQSQWGVDYAAVFKAFS